MSSGDTYRVMTSGYEVAPVQYSPDLVCARDVSCGGGLKIGGIQVMGPQGAAVADATGTGDVVAQLNTLLARARDAGWIAS